jgi:hypothetical protein
MLRFTINEDKFVIKGSRKNHYDSTDVLPSDFETYDKLE